MVFQGFSEPFHRDSKFHWSWRLLKDLANFRSFSGLSRVSVLWNGGLSGKLKGTRLGLCLTPVCSRNHINWTTQTIRIRIQNVRTYTCRVFPLGAAGLPCLRRTLIGFLLIQSDHRIIHACIAWAIRAWELKRYECTDSIEKVNSETQLITRQERTIKQFYTDKQFMNSSMEAINIDAWPALHPTPFPGSYSSLVQG